MSQRPSPRWLAPLTVVVLAGFATAEGCSAGTGPSDEGANANAAPSATSGTGGSGGAMQGACAIDCTTIQTPQCQTSTCNTMTLQCDIVPDLDGGACEDGQFCTAGDTCQAGICTAGSPNTCGMTADPCQQINCDEAADSCMAVASGNGTACQPADLCVAGATCTGGACVGGSVKDCFFFPVPNVCHNAVCNPMNGVCEPVPGNDGLACVDPMTLCTPGKTCLTGVCQGGTPLDCSFLTQGCNLGVCNPMNGMCTTMAVMNGQPCDDLNGCTTGETCTNQMCGGGAPVTVCEMMGDGCCPMTCNASTDLDCAIQPSCLAIKTSVPSSTSGIYTIDPDSSGPIQQFQVYCDMTEDLGGWSLIARFANIDTDDWMLDTGEWWYTRLTPAGQTTSRTANADMISTAFWSVVGNELRITRTDNPSDAHLLRTTNSCLGNKHFRQFITMFGNFQNGMIWSNDAVLGTCPASLGGNYTTTNGFQYATCASVNIGAPNSISFWADWSSGDGAVMMIGGGGTSCGRADHGIGITEANSSSFIDGGAGEEDFGNNAVEYNDAYALNLWVR